MSNFTIEHYKQTISKYKHAGWSFDDLENKSENKSIIMTHDVDHDILNCNNLVEAESECQITATYFLRLHAQSYNMLSRRSISVAKRILDSGCNLGLHYEPKFCSDGQSYEDHIENEIQILSNILNTKIHHFNIHEPARTNINLKNFAKDKNRCYNSQFFNGYKYLSDSSCRWREGCFSEHLGKWNKMLVLTHPLWWYNKCPSENY